MRNLKHLVLITGLSAATAVTCFTGCSTWRQKTSERSEGRIVDDHKIASRVKSELKKEPVYKFDDVDVRTFDGVVQLSGFVNSEEQKRRAEELAKQVPGVVEVQNAISLKPNAGSYTPTGRNNRNNYNTQNPNDPNNNPATPNRTTNPNQ
jgi:hypothetical protein